MSHGRVHHLIYLGKWKAVFGTILIETCEAYTNSPLAVILFYHNRVTKLDRIQYLLDHIFFIQFIDLFNNNVYVLKVDLLPLYVTGRAFGLTLSLCLI